MQCRAADWPRMKRLALTRRNGNVLETPLTALIHSSLTLAAMTLSWSSWRSNIVVRLAVSFGRFAALLSPAAGLADCALSLSDALKLLAASSRSIVASTEGRRKAGRWDCVAPKANGKLSAAATRRRAANVSPPTGHHRLDGATHEAQSIRQLLSCYRRMPMGLQLHSRWAGCLL
jgi:hypothetical protein